VAEYPEYAGIDILIETGTFMGDVAWHDSQLFKEIHTIEVKEDLYKKAKTRLNSKANVACYCGDSADVLPAILKRIKTRCIFFLDAHWSGDSSVNWKESSWKGYGIETGLRNKKGHHPSPENQSPLKDEIELIVKLHPYQSVIVIDDWLVLNTKNSYFKGEDWIHINIDVIISIIGREKIRAIFTMDQIIRGRSAKMLVILLK